MSFMEILKAVHGIISNTVVLFFLALGIWGVYRAFRRYTVDGSYIGALVIGEALFVLQGILGAVLYLGDARPGRVVHFIYGSFVLVALPGLFAYLKGDDSNQAQLYFGLAAISLFGVALRAISTGA